MSFKDEQFIPKAPRNIALRPINKGMVRNIQSNALPPGSVLTAKNLIVGTQGPMRRPGMGVLAGDSTFLFPPIRGIIALTKTDGTQVSVVFDNRMVYVFTATGYTQYTWDYTVGTINASAASVSVSGIGTAWASGAELQAGDILITGSGATLDRIEIGAIGGNAALTLRSSLANAHTQTDYTIYRSLGANNPYMTVWTLVDNKLLFADSSRALYSFDGSDFDEYDASLTFIPSCVEFFKDRVWCGHIQIGAADHRQRITWSELIDHTAIDPTANYIDLDYQQGACQRLKGMGNLLIGYFEDAIYYGRQTNIKGDTLPYAFERIETGGIGLVGMNAVTPFLDGHFFVGQDNIYFLSNKGFERVGTSVVSETVDKTSSPWAIYAAVDTERQRVVFGFPEDGSDNMAKLWSFDYIAKAWSYDEIVCTCIAGRTSTDAVTWDGTDESWANVSYPSWDSARGGITKRFYIGKEGKIKELISSRTTDVDGGVIPIELVTPDFDDNLPDIKKTSTRVSIKIDRVLASDLVFRIYASTDRGRTWTAAQVGTIAAGDDEIFVNFLVSGSTIRYRITSDSDIGTYRIIEIVRRVKGRGLEIQLGPTD